MYQRDQLNFSQNQQANYLTFAGVKIIIGGEGGIPHSRHRTGTGTGSCALISAACAAPALLPQGCWASL